jgi:hypothetical protein
MSEPVRYALSDSDARVGHSRSSTSRARGCEDRRRRRSGEERRNEAAKEFGCKTYTISAKMLKLDDVEVGRRRDAFQGSRQRH